MSLTVPAVPQTLTCRAVLFDMDGTLVDSTAVVEQVWGEFAARYGLDYAQILRTSHGDRAVLLLTGGTLLAAALFASWLPARSAMKVAPRTAMAAE